MQMATDRSSAAVTRAARNPTENEISTNHAPPPRRGIAGLERKSAAAILGESGLKRSSVLEVRPSGSGLPRLSAPAENNKESMRPKGIKLVMHRLLEMTPGTNQHKREYGTRWAVGTYRLTHGQRSGPAQLQ
jgi:hypothetical protein